jgi:hypothetical protein
LCAASAAQWLVAPLMPCNDDDSQIGCDMGHISSHQTSLLISCPFCSKPAPTGREITSSGTKYISE